MRHLFAALPAVLCFAQDADLPSQLSRLQRLPTEQIRSLQAKLAMDIAPAEKKAYHELHLAYVLASRTRQEDPKGCKTLVEASLKGFEATPDPESQALIGAFLGLKIGFSPMSGMTLSPKAMGLFNEALAKRPGSPRIALLRAIHLLHTPAFVGGGVKVAIPLMEAAVALAEKEAAPSDPWAPAWGRIESLGWLAYAQAEAEQFTAAKATAERALALDPGNGFVTRMVLPRLQGKAQ
jgi:tetratricopeptide (TPR) repeat protein